MHISEVEAFLSTSRLSLPQHVFVINETVWQEVDGQILYRGLAPKKRSDVIVLTPHAITETVGHECAHASLGMGEFGATVIGKMSAMKYRVLNHFPNVKALAERPVRYEKCNGSCDFPKAHQYGNRVEHYVLKR